jgi:glutamate synthase (NADPH/NADH) small chain
MEYLTQHNTRISNKSIEGKPILATNKDVVVIGGGDTGSDCIGTANRQKSKSILQLELLPMPPSTRPDSTPWPMWPSILNTSTSHEEGCERKWSLLTKEFVGDSNQLLKAIKVVDVELFSKNGKVIFKEVPNTERLINCDLALIAIGFLHPLHEGLLNQLGVAYDEMGNVKCHNFQTSVSGIFAAGDIHRGQSLVVWAISEGREAARSIDEFLMGTKSTLESKDKAKCAM